MDRGYTLEGTQGVEWPSKSITDANSRILDIEGHSKGELFVRSVLIPTY